MAEDTWEERLYVAAFGDVELDILSTQDEAGRTLAHYRRPHHDGGRSEDMGGAIRVTRCRVIFFQRDAGDDHLERFRDFETLKRRGVVDTFVHPLTGSYDARIQEFAYSAEATIRDCIMVDCTFVEDTDDPAVLDIGAGAPLESGASEVAAALDDLDAALAEVEARERLAGARNDMTPTLKTSIGADAVATAEGWEDADLGKTTRDVQLELTAMHDRIETAIEDYELATDVNRYPILRALTALGYSLHKAAEVFQARAPKIVEYELPSPMSLLSFCTRKFGASQAQARYDEIRQLNDIRNPARLEAGTRIKAQAPQTSTERLRTRTP